MNEWMYEWIWPYVCNDILHNNNNIQTIQNNIWDWRKKKEKQEFTYKNQLSIIHLYYIIIIIMWFRFFFLSFYFHFWNSIQHVVEIRIATGFLMNKFIYSMCVCVCVIDLDVCLTFFYKKKNWRIYNLNLSLSLSVFISLWNSFEKCLFWLWYSFSFFFFFIYFKCFFFEKKTEM